MCSRRSASDRRADHWCRLSSVPPDVAGPRSAVRPGEGGAYRNHRRSLRAVRGCRMRSEATSRRDVRSVARALSLRHANSVALRAAAVSTVDATHHRTAHAVARVSSAAGNVVALRCSGCRLVSRPARTGRRPGRRMAQPPPIGENAAPGTLVVFGAVAGFVRHRDHPTPATADRPMQRTLSRSTPALRVRHVAHAHGHALELDLRSAPGIRRRRLPAAARTHRRRPARGDPRRPQRARRSAGRGPHPPAAGGRARAPSRAACAAQAGQGSAARSQSGEGASHRGAARPDRYPHAASQAGVHHAELLSAAATGPARSTQRRAGRVAVCRVAGTAALLRLQAEVYADPPLLRPAVPDLRGAQFHQAHRDRRPHRACRAADRWPGQDRLPGRSQTAARGLFADRHHAFPARLGAALRAGAGLRRVGRPAGSVRPRSAPHPERRGVLRRTRRHARPARLHRQQRLPDRTSSAGVLRAHDGRRNRRAARVARTRAQARRRLRRPARGRSAAGRQPVAGREQRGPRRPRARRGTVAGAAARRRTGRPGASVPRRSRRQGSAAGRSARAQLMAAADGRSAGGRTAGDAAGQRGRAFHPQCAPEDADDADSGARQAHRQRVRGRGAVLSQLQDHQASAHQHGQGRAQHDDAHLGRGLPRRRHPHECRRHRLGDRRGSGGDRRAQDRRGALSSAARHRRRRGAHRRSDHRRHQYRHPRLGPVPQGLQADGLVSRRRAGGRSAAGGFDRLALTLRIGVDGRLRRARIVEWLLYRVAQMRGLRFGRLVRRRRTGCAAEQQQRGDADAGAVIADGGMRNHALTGHAALRRTGSALS
ncbi:putative LigA [Luteimonas sp. 9C]|nr:putative LigA [Luteimonas sp. 9C]